VARKERGGIVAKIEAWWRQAAYFACQQRARMLLSPGTRGGFIRRHQDVRCPTFAQHHQRRSRAHHIDHAARRARQIAQGCRNLAWRRHHIKLHVASHARRTSTRRDAIARAPA